MRPTSSWVKERSSQYLIYLVIISNSQPYNKLLHIEKKNKKKFKISKQKIYIYFYTYTPILLTNIILDNKYNIILYNKLLTNIIIYNKLLS